MKNWLLKGLVAGIAYFFLGWLVYGILLDSFFSGQANPAAEVLSRGDEMLMWAMIVSSLALGLLISFILVRAKIATFWCSVKTAVIFGLLFSLTVDLSQYSMMDVTSLKAIWVDVIAFTVISAILGALTFFVGKAEEAEAE